MRYKIKALTFEHDLTLANDMTDTCMNFESNNVLKIVLTLYHFVHKISYSITMVEHKTTMEHFDCNNNYKIVPVIFDDFQNLTHLCSVHHRRIYDVMKLQSVVYLYELIILLKFFSL